MSEETGVKRPTKDNPYIQLIASRKYWVWVVIAVIVAVLITLAQLNHLSKERAKEKAKAPKCTAEILKRADKVLDNGSPLDLGNLAAEVKAIPGYETDPNCVFIVTKYYVSTDDADNSTDSFNRLVSITPDGNKLHISNKHQGKVSLDGLKNVVDSLVQKNKALQQNEGYEDGVIPPGGAQKP